MAVDEVLSIPRAPIHRTGEHLLELSKVPLLALRGYSTLDGCENSQSLACHVGARLSLSN